MQNHRNIAKEVEMLYPAEMAQPTSCVRQTSMGKQDCVERSLSTRKSSSLPHKMDRKLLKDKSYSPCFQAPSLCTSQSKSRQSVHNTRLWSGIVLSLRLHNG
jgi:hypothetical protein